MNLFELEALVPAAAREVLLARTPDVLTPGSSAKTPRSMTAVRFELGGVTGRQCVRAVGGQPVTDFCEYTGTLSVDLGVAREENTPSGGADAPVVSRALTAELAAIRALFLNHPNPFVNRLPYWQVTELRPQPTAYDLDPERQIDFATLSWQLTLTLLPGAFPEIE